MDRPIAAPAEWWKEFFQGVTQEMWARAATPEMTLPEVEFLAQELGVQGGGQVLDVPCGNGRITLELAARGLSLSGIDLAAENIAAARASAEQGGLAIDFHQGDMRQLPWRGEFDAAFCFGNSFGYFDEAGNARFLASVAASLQPGGRFVLDAPIVAESLLLSFEARAWYQLDDLYCLAGRRYDPRTGRLEVEYRFLFDGREEIRRASYRAYTLRELIALLEAAGFTDIAAYGSHAREPFALGSPGLVLSAVAHRSPA
jgi:SAM-dependent methyltransferase